VRKETMNKQMSNWRLERIPVTRIVQPPSSSSGVKLTEIDQDRNYSGSAGSWTGYPYISLKK
jgi:hypothetical protein